MENNQSSMGRMELAHSYFPFILPRSAWQKFKSLPLILRFSPSSADARSFRRKSTLFTSTWGTRKVPYFRGFQSTQTLWQVNSNFAPSKPPLCDVHSSVFIGLRVGTGIILVIL